jgi:hypothetical protein
MIQPAAWLMISAGKQWWWCGSGGGFMPSLSPTSGQADRSGYIIPQYLGVIQKYRALESGVVLIWVAMPQLLLAPIIAAILRFVKQRITMAFGFTLIGCACFMAVSSRTTGQAMISCHRKSCRRSARLRSRRSLRSP